MKLLSMIFTYVLLIMAYLVVRTASWWTRSGLITPDVSYFI
jgi:hypothetical protein